MESSKKRAYYEANREEIAAKQRARYRAKKKEVTCGEAAETNPG